MDSLSLKRIELLHPHLRASAKQILKEITDVLTGRAQVRFTFTWRSFSEQDGLYAKGRTIVNPDGKSKTRPYGYKVTNAKGGQSMHNYGLAIDIALIIDGKEASWNDVKDWDGDGLADWMECVAIFKKHGWTWGGDWSSFIDKPHFQYTFGLTTSQLQAMYKAGNFISGTTYLNIRQTSVREYRTTTGLNLRSGLGTSNSVILVIPGNTKVVELQRINDWSKVAFGTKEGWVANKYLTK